MEMYPVEARRALDTATPMGPKAQTYPQQSPTDPVQLPGVDSSFLKVLFLYINITEGRSRIPD
jgi:hypothetical protein